jgi:ADP-ribose pyrophosphatase YjhB (NUDIX family)
MISFDQGSCRFNYRVAGVAVRPSDGRILMHRTEHDNFWSLPGGRCDMDEVSTVALAREMQEEIGASAQVGRLLIVAENFFNYANTRYHEIGLYFLIDFPQDAWVYEQTGAFPGYEPTIPLIYQWVSLEESARGETLPIFPTFLPEALTAFPETPRHFIQRENDDVPGNPKTQSE